MFIVKLEKGVWLAPWKGDPGRTIVKSHAKCFNTAKGAKIAATKSLGYKEFDNPKVVEVDEFFNEVKNV